MEYLFTYTVHTMCGDVIAVPEVLPGSEVDTHIATLLTTVGTPVGKKPRYLVVPTAKGVSVISGTILESAYVSFDIIPVVESEKLFDKDLKQDNDLTTFDHITKVLKLL